jgi:heme O synthase-like polyprenyltransferase
VAVLLNLRFGLRSEHYGLALLTSVGGGAVSLRQILLHVCPQFPTFGFPVFGYDLYVWAFIVFTCSVLGAAILLIVHGFSHHKDPILQWDHWGQSAFWLIVLVVLVNLVTIIQVCGLSACAG